MGHICHILIFYKRLNNYSFGNSSHIECGYRSPDGRRKWKGNFKLNVLFSILTLSSDTPIIIKLLNLE